MINRDRLRCKRCLGPVEGLHMLSPSNGFHCPKHPKNALIFLNYDQLEGVLKPESAGPRADKNGQLSLLG